MLLFESIAIGPESNYEQTARLALALARRVLPEYATRCSRKCFTMRQLAALVVVRAAFNLTYRQLHELLKASPALGLALGLKRVPHFTTVEGFANRPGMDTLVQRMLDELYALIGATLTPGGDADADARPRRPRVDEAAMDSTALQPTTASVHFHRKKYGSAKGPYRAFAKLSVVVCCGLMMPCAMIAGWGPSADTQQAAALMRQATGRARIGVVYADAGYDSEPLHTLCREELGVTSVIPPIIRTADGSIRTRYRSQMRPLPESYGKRWIAESFMSAFKRTTGSTLRARGTTRPLTEMILRVLGFAIRR